MKKSLIAILMTAVIVLSLAAPLIAVPSAKADDAGDYMTVNGVLDSDYYTLYPYETDNSLKVGFSKYGELINQEENVGLEYGEVDPYAFPVGSGVSSTVPKRMWVQGWLINITYTHRTLGPRNVWACAISADSVAYGNDWIRVDFNNDWSSMYGYEDPRDPGYLIYGEGTYGTTLVNGGRKTNGTAVTDGIEVLYDGPREFIAVCRTTIYDHLIYGSNSVESDVALAQIAITIRFDKVKKDVVLLKDVKSLLVEKEGIKMKIQFSNRGEVDLGTETAGISSYAHFFVEGVDDRGKLYGEGKSTVYNANWTIIQTENPDDTEYINYSLAGPFPQTTDVATYDVAQAINPEAGYVWSAAFWPSLNDWSIDGWDQWWHSLTANDPHYVDGVEEPFIPFYIGEWDFILYHTLDTLGRTQFRGVTQYSVGEWHDGDDADMDSINYLDSEVQYYCNETFNPWDLQDAVHKDTRRWLEWKQANAGSTLTTSHKPVIVVDDDVWDDYCVFADRVIDYTTGRLLDRSMYDVTLLADGTARFSGLISSHKYKILYSTCANYSLLDVDPFLFQYNDTSVDVEYPTVSVSDDDDQSWTDPLGMQWLLDVDDLNFVVTALNTTDSWNASLSRELNGWEVNFEVFKGTTYTGSWDFQDLAIMTDDANVSIDISLVDIEWSVYNPTLQDLKVLGLGFTATLTFDMFYNATGDYLEINATLDADPAEDYVGMMYMYYEKQMGRYEWVEMGRDAKTVDNAGSALVAEAYDSLKEIQIGIAGADMASADVSMSMPSVMAKFGSGTSASDYKDALLRAALKDDWCTYWPVASSNMIGVGGPVANLLEYYANDFTDAFYGLSEFAGAAYFEQVVPITCWNRNWPNNPVAGYNTYSSYDNSSVGYAVISTYKDINGTVLFNVWGHWGRDTYYASMWLHGDEARGLAPGIIELQSAPKGVTSIILEIDYTDPSHPTYSVPEVLGTISERLWYHVSTDVTDPYKGGIHDP